jgi:hypothetical protein
LKACTTGEPNTAYGARSLSTVVDGTLNSAFGYYALNLCLGHYNSAFGDNALANQQNVDNNSAFGYRSQINTTTGDMNTSVGSNSLYTNTTGASNVAVGYYALNACTTGGGNVALGKNAAKLLTTGGNTVVIGASGTGITTGSSINCIGYDCLSGTTTGTQLVYIGQSCGDSGVTGQNNIAIGYHAGRANAPSGNITSGSNIICLGNNNISALYCADTSISSSDQRDKTDIENFTAGLSFVNQMRPITYRWDKRTDYVGMYATAQDILDVVPDGTHKEPKQNVGFLSQEIEVLEKEIGFSSSKLNQLFCNTNEDDTSMGLKYERMVPVLVNAIKELSTKNDTLQARVLTLENA